MNRPTNSLSPSTEEATDCARPGVIGPLWRGIVVAVFGFPILVVGFLFLAMIVDTWSGFEPNAKPDNHEGFVPAAVIGGLALLIGWPLSMTAIKFLRQAFDRRAYIRVGNRGISICVPGDSIPFWCGYGLQKYDASWDDVDHFTVSYGIEWDTFSGDLFEIKMRSGRSHRFRMRTFAESSYDISGNITEAMKVHCPRALRRIFG